MRFSATKVLVNGIEITTSEINKISANSLNIVVESSDDYGVVSSNIMVNDKHLITSGQNFAIDTSISGIVYKLLVTVLDASGNEVSEKYSHFKFTLNLKQQKKSYNYDNYREHNRRQRACCRP